MSIRHFFCLSFIFCLTAASSQNVYVKDMPVSEHPRLLFFEKDEPAIKKLIATSPELEKVDRIIKAEAKKMLALSVLERKQVGRRLLGVSREALRRIMFTAYTYRMTRNKQYADGAEKEMLAISKFDNWNPSHFLDVAEMTLAMAIGYDWLYQVLGEPSRQQIKTAIIEKGLKPSLISKHNSWLRTDNNWNQVCNGGLTLGALAVFEEEPGLAKDIINRSVESIKLAMSVYGPDGAYPEGSGYWTYGTSYNVLFLSALEKIYKTDFGLSSIKGFMGTAGYVLHVHGTTGNAFNYSDNGSGRGFNTSMLWFADKLKRPELLRNEMLYVNSGEGRRMAGDRLLPTFLIWGHNVAGAGKAVPKELMWVGGGLSPVALMRTSWTDKDAISLGLKAGSADVNHAHMDIGSFVMEADGERWAMDFGMQNYESLESKGMNIFGRSQYAQRWTIFRYINPAHNTLTFNDSLQRVNGRAEITRHSSDPANMFAISDLSKVYKGEIKSAIRGVAIKNKSYVLIQDEIETLSEPATMRWSMATPAQVKVISKNEIMLSKNGKELRVQIDASQPVQIKTWNTEPTTSYDAENPGTVIVGFETTLPANSVSQFGVNLLPGGGKNKSVEKLVPLAAWK